MIGQYYRVLDKGYVCLKDVMGSDASIEEAARVSYQTETRKVSDTTQLIRYLMRHSHLTPFEMVEFKFHLKLPIHVARQLIRTRTASVNEVSGRYSVLPTEFHICHEENYGKQSATNKQGRGDVFSKDEYSTYKDWIEELQGHAATHYNALIQGGVAREIARMDLPLSTFTNMYWKIDLRNLLNFLSLRLDSHAQHEIRCYAQVMAAMVREITPIAFQAFLDYTVDSVKFTKDELVECICLASYAGKSSCSMQDIIDAYKNKWVLLKGREINEFLEKLSKKSLCVPKLGDFEVINPI